MTIFFNIYYKFINNDFLTYEFLVHRVNNENGRQYANYSKNFAKLSPKIGKYPPNCRQMEFLYNFFILQMTSKVQIPTKLPPKIDKFPPNSRQNKFLCNFFIMQLTTKLQMTTKLPTNYCQ